MAVPVRMAYGTPMEYIRAWRRFSLGLELPPPTRVLDPTQFDTHERDKPFQILGDLFRMTHDGNRPYTSQRWSDEQWTRYLERFREIQDQLINLDAIQAFLFNLIENPEHVPIVEGLCLDVPKTKRDSVDMYPVLGGDEYSVTCPRISILCERVVWPDLTLTDIDEGRSPEECFGVHLTGGDTKADGLMKQSHSFLNGNYDPSGGGSEPLITIEEGVAVTILDARYNASTWPKAIGSSRGVDFQP